MGRLIRWTIMGNFPRHIGRKIEKISPVLRVEVWYRFFPVIFDVCKAKIGVVEKRKGEDEKANCDFA